jgi:hypothetical protein
VCWSGGGDAWSLAVADHRSAQSVGRRNLACCWPSCSCLVRSCLQGAGLSSLLAATQNLFKLFCLLRSSPTATRFLLCLQSLMMNNPTGAVALAKMVVKQTPPPLDVNSVADLFLQVGSKLLGCWVRPGVLSLSSTAPARRRPVSRAAG